VIRFRSANSSALSERVLEVDGNAVLLEQIAESLVGQLLKIRHPVARELLEFVESVIVKGDQFAHDRPAPASQARVFNSRRWKSFRLGTARARSDHQFERGPMLLCALAIGGS
jgi:hypothetical protein